MTTEFVRVNPFNGLKSPAAFRLGKVTAICGRNGSGKSTILEGLARHNGFEVGIPTVQVAENLVTTLVQSIAAQSNLDYYIRQLRPLFPDLTATLPVAFSGDADRALAATRKILARLEPHQRYQPNVEFFSKQYKTFFPGPPPLALLPVKRLVQTRVSLQPGETAKPSGEGLLNDLFFLSAQPSQSPERILFERIHSTFADLTGGQVPVLKPDRDGTLSLHFRRAGKDLIPAQHSGQGLVDLLVILRFALGPEAELVLIEEPELHMHADLQRRLNVLLQEIPQKQFLLATHSNVYLHPAVSDVVLLTKYDDGVTIADMTSRAGALTELGYSLSDNLASEAILLTEGPYDGEAYRVLFEKAGLNPETPYRTWGLGGDNMDKFDLSTITEHYKVAAIVDGDPKSLKIRKRFARKCKALKIPCFVLERGSIEHYFPTRAIRNVFPQLPNDLPEFLLEGQSAADQVAWSLKKSLRKIADTMDGADLRGTDLLSALKAVKKCFDA